MKFEDKVKLGVEAVGKLKAGMDMSDIMHGLMMTCMFDTMTCPDGEEADLIELIILGANEDAIESTAKALYEGVIGSDDEGKIAEYKQMVSAVKELAEKLGKSEVIGNFLPIHTLIGMAMIKAGERLMCADGAKDINKEEK